MPSPIVKSTPELVESYRQLLGDDWSIDTVQRILELLWAEVGSQENNIPAWWGVLDPHRQSDNIPNNFILERVRYLAKVLTDPVIPVIPTVVIGGGEWACRAETAWGYLILQSLTHLAGDVGLLADTQSALFITCADYLLPRLKSDGLTMYHDTLINALHSYTFLVWRNKPNHMYHLQAVLMGYIGDTGERLRLLRQSLHLTSQHDHSYITKVQSYWSELVDLGQYKLASDLILDVYRGASRDDVPELSEMLYLTQRGMAGLIAT
jgi:hypothetical protein